MSSRGGAQESGDEDSGEAPAPGARTDSDVPQPGHGTSDRRIDTEQVRLLRLRMIHAERGALLDARDDGTFSAAALGAALEELDAEQISIELKGPGCGIGHPSPYRSWGAVRQYWRGEHRRSPDPRGVP